MAKTLSDGELLVFGWPCCLTSYQQHQASNMDDNLDDLLKDLIMEEKAQQPATAQVEEETLDNLLGKRLDGEGEQRSAKSALPLFFFPLCSWSDIRNRRPDGGGAARAQGRNSVGRSRGRTRDGGDAGGRTHKDEDWHLERSRNDEDRYFYGSWSQDGSQRD